ncbi:hypothetical protein LMTR3_35710 [Bradyrhizobium sp. LMTR 3]|nr:hypothetical protein LMTR3_35710 [Bradyrhizobium sp. LMTR 3]
MRFFEQCNKRPIIAFPFVHAQLWKAPGELECSPIGTSSDCDQMQHSTWGEYRGPRVWQRLSLFWFELKANIGIVSNDVRKLSKSPTPRLG